jgi:hypothetical protein
MLSIVFNCYIIQHGRHVFVFTFSWKCLQPKNNEWRFIVDDQLYNLTENVWVHLNLLANLMLYIYEWFINFYSYKLSSY